MTMTMTGRTKLWAGALLGALCISLAGHAEDRGETGSTETADGERVSVAILQVGKLEADTRDDERVLVFAGSSVFAPGDTVAVVALLLDSANRPMAGANFIAEVSGPARARISSSSADERGFAVATWNTSDGTPSGGYEATVTGASAEGRAWDEVGLAVKFELE
jgi:uncharacterized protein YfaS (alpha-2-macroglobulin family)